MSAATRNPRAVQTRSALLRAGFDLLADRPIDAIPINDIVAAAGVAKGSFFNHFEDKDAFAEAIATEIRIEVEAMVTAANAGLADPLERLSGGYLVAAGFALSQPRRAIVMLRGLGSGISQNHPLNAGVAADLAACIEAGVVRSDIAEAATGYWIGACTAAMGFALDRGARRADRIGRIAALLALALRGLGADEARIAVLAATAGRLA